jgi:hypothetical protein
VCAHVPTRFKHSLSLRASPASGDPDCSRLDYLFRWLAIVLEALMPVASPGCSLRQPIFKDPLFRISRSRQHGPASIPGGHDHNSRRAWPGATLRRAECGTLMVRNGAIGPNRLIEYS